MGLDQTSRGELEKLIDDVIKLVPNQMALWRNPETKKEYFITDEKDFVLGYAISQIYTGFRAIFATRYFRQPNLEEDEEIYKVIHKRIREIRDAMYESG